MTATHSAPSRQLATAFRDWRRALPGSKPLIFLATSSGKRRASIARALRPLDCNVVSVAHGRDLIELLADAFLDQPRGAQPALIITEAALPGCSGITLLSGLKHLGWETPVVLLTRTDQQRERDAAWRLGVAGVFIRPYNLDELRSFSRLVLDPDVAALVRAARRGRRPAAGAGALEHQ